jgi:Raf kinase inhibitor-like YbhB/YbcL family protein
MPEGTRSVALMLEKLEGMGREENIDPGTILWLVFNIAPEVTALPEGLRLDEPMGRDGLRPVHGGNHQRTTGYAGPCPSVGDPGRYAFRVYALDGVLPPEAGATGRHLIEAMEGHILAEGELIGTYAY